MDQRLRNLAQRRAALDAEEARCLREAERLQIWRELGMVSAIDYLERVLGYAPHAAMERLRVARALASLPLLEDALDAGQLNFSAVRELTRVATPSTEDAWRDRALGKNVRQIEELVAGHAPGDHPDEPANPELRLHDVRFRLSPEIYARLRQTQATLADERDGRLDDNALVEAFCEAVLARDDVERHGRAKFQIMMTICKQCEQGWQEGSGVQVPIDAATVERARCDAQYIGSTTDDVPVRATQDIPPSVVRYVYHRDGGRCTTPGCRSARGLEIHHRTPRSEGGSHDHTNLGLKCSACHRGVHRGTLEVVGNDVKRPNEPSHVGRTFEVAATRTQARDALVGLGWKPTIARAAVDEAIARIGHDPPLEELIREALRCCPRPTAASSA
ncbi:MAG: HNH endonuclease [Myxococcota bacterium]|nr:HNH endonuclease [Myxococcota bacterium]